MKYRIFFVGLVSCWLAALPFFCSAQDSGAVSFSRDTTIVCNKYASVKEDARIMQLAAKYDEYNRKKEFTDGYRIQIMYTDIRSDAYKNKGQMYKDFPDLSSYVEYEEPYYKLRIGDFKTRLEATYYMQQVTPLFSGAFIVKDKIKIKQ
jgi:hypothetical protein